MAGSHSPDAGFLPGQLAMTSSPFIIFSLPRSRSKWTSEWLKSSGLSVAHDLGIDCGSVSDFLGYFQQGLAGTCETGAGFAWKLLRYYMPKARFLTIHRPRAEVLASLARFGLFGLEEEMLRRELMLQVIAQQPGTMSLSWESLDHPDCCEKLWDFAMGPQAPDFDFDNWQNYNLHNIQVDMGERLSRLFQNHRAIEGLKAEVLAQQRALPGGSPCGNLQ